MLAMKPTPQESFSSEGSYRPSASGRQVCSSVCNSVCSSRSAGFESAVADSVSATMCSRSNSDPLMSSLPVRASSLSSAHLGRSAAPQEKFGGSPLVLEASRIFRVQAQRSTSLENGFAWYLAALGAELSLQSLCRFRNEI